nr:unnamed protein product [Spirometra erinaceieuropaei]
MTAESNQTSDRCPLCRTETHFFELEPEASAISSREESSADCKTSEPATGDRGQGSNAVDPVSEVLDIAMKKLTDLSSGRISLESLKTTLCRFRDETVSCKENLLGEITAVDHQLYYPAFYSLEKAKLLVVSTFTDELVELKKLQRNLLRLKRRLAALLQTANSLPEEIDFAALKELEQSAGKILESAKDFQQSLESRDASGFDNLELARNFESIHSQLRNLSLVTSDIANLREQLALFPTEAQCGHPEEQRSTEVDWNLDLNKVFLKRLPEVTNECDLHAYFSNFGLIANVVLKDSMGSASVRCGFVTFFERDSVRRVLDTQPHLLGEDRIIACVARKKQSDHQGSVDPGVSVADNDDGDFSNSDDDQPSNDAFCDQLTMFVGHLKQEITESDLTTYFSQFGRVTDASIIHDWATGESRGYGFVTFADSRAFQAGVLKACHFLKGCRLSVKLSVNRLLSRTPTVLPPPPSMFAKPAGADVNPKGIFVDYLSETTEDCDLHEYFSKFGIITEVIVLKGKRSGDTRRNGFVTFRDTDAVKMVFDAWPHLLNGKHIGVFPAWSRKSGQFIPQTQTSMSNESASASALNKRTIFVGRLKPTTTAADLETYFSKFGSVSRAKVATHLYSSQCRSFGYVEFSDRKAFEGGVLEACHFLNGSRLKVELYERRTSSNSDSDHT